ncbi:class I SAM-dependent methyltransferase [Flavihumibacter cheonanensis]|uniref:class I SAM-dependent methyltransferase n=1 Tax=Flavihumibacter cheonanensis TaxID=1442385 RepID=UPI001EF98F11|nr:class I SAM-dependent methyltransferase [Flavihumibacter cheonanensis]MCG7750879.1 class I SAM-dependent methyltransferase [Flavihumibacter cheonanensis]
MSTKTVQGKLWSISPQNWSTHFELYFLPLYKKALQELEISPDTMLLDAGCGSGMFSSMAIDAGAQVIGIDAAPGLLELARQRNPQNNFMEEDLEAMPFASNSFHVVTGFNSFQYAGNFRQALSEAHRVLKPGGTLVLAIWDKPANSDGTDVLKAISTLLPPPLPGTPGPFSLSEDGKMEEYLKETGFNLINSIQISCPFIYQSLGNGIRSFMGTGPAAAVLNYADKKQVEETIAAALQPYRIVDDIYFQQNSFLLFIAKK